MLIKLNCIQHCLARVEAYCFFSDAQEGGGVLFTAEGLADAQQRLAQVHTGIIFRTFRPEKLGDGLAGMAAAGFLGQVCQDSALFFGAQSLGDIFTVEFDFDGAQ